MTVPGNLLTTAMAVMPHTDVDRALEAALKLDVPFWPQLPNYSYREDMYVQAAEHFPGMIVDMEERTLKFSVEGFAEGLERALALMEESGPALDVSEEGSLVYRRFLELDLAARPAIRGQLEGPVSFGFNVLDQDGRPIIFDDTVREFMLDFMARRVNVQLHGLRERNPNAFMFVDEPGLQYLFSAMAGYNELRAKSDMDRFFAAVERPRGVHLCGNPDWGFLLDLDLDVLSMDIYTNAEIFSAQAPQVEKFLERGGVIVWGIVPTGHEEFGKEDVTGFADRLEGVWKRLWSGGVDPGRMIARSMISPATCCLVNPDGAATVERAFDAVNELATILKDKHL